LSDNLRLNLLKQSASSHSNEDDNSKEASHEVIYKDESKLSDAKSYYFNPLSTLKSENPLKPKSENPNLKLNFLSGEIDNEISDLQRELDQANRRSAIAQTENRYRFTTFF
jgi:hypothetical protein